MKTPARPPHELDLTGVLTPDQFKEGVDLWLQTRSAGGSSLTGCLLAPDNTTRLPAVYFPVMQIVELVSVVGVQSIRARFVVLRDGQQQPRFTVALYATAADGTVLSSYYLANRYWLLQAGSPVPRSSARPLTVVLNLGSSVSKNVVPKALASYWVNNWANQKRYPTSPELFTSAGQALQGYNFLVSDLVDPLRGINEYGNQLLAMNFGLHTFLHSTGKTDAPIATLGVMLQMTGTTEKDEAGAGDDSFNMVVPSPPAP